MQVPPVKPALPKPGLLRWEIGVALLIKIILLTGLWFLIFRWMDKPAGKPDVAEHFALPISQTATPHSFSSQPLKESRHDR
ncbi:hypothetical protein IVG45_21600 [Methylomonas sp. LL1]|uniref:hypothetical protein n=1 Tax=Methylomonas sp. LL1 TaxID=2785785 RepID=UPI0018C39506|nr:hypothetical protein [Methylomonas sp. LL1]QPK63362.1 hypothetical protein IVG45_21600 [Methylomonas sp. LL1]